MKNRELYLKDPLTLELLNNGVSKVAEIGHDGQQLKTLRFELENFVCDGEYARGLERILGAYLDGLNKPEQQAVWVSGFFGSGKSHLVKMLRYLWVDYKFPDGASARSIVRLPQEIQDRLVELTNRSRQYGGLKAVSGTLGAGNLENVRLAFLQLIFRAEGLPESLAGARFVLWLKEKGYLDKVAARLKSLKKDPEKEIRNFYVSTSIAEALVQLEPNYGNTKNAQEAIRAQFPTNASSTIDDMLQIVRQIFLENGRSPCTVIVVDEIQQFIGDKIQRTLDIQEIAEHCCRALDSRLLLVGTGQSALTATPNLQRLQARFTIKVPLSDTDVESVIRQTVLAKKHERVQEIQKVIKQHQGEISRHLQNTRIAATTADEEFYAPDYPLLPVRRRFWEKVLRNVDTSGAVAQLRTQLKIVYDAARESADLDVGNVVSGDFIYDEISTDLLNTGVLQREYHEIIVGQRDKTNDGVLKSRLCALVFLIHQLPRKPGADDGIRATAENLADLLVQDLGKDGPKLRAQVPKLLEELTSRGKLMLVDNEYCLQTREGAVWNHEFNKQRSTILNDEPRLSAAREQVLQEALAVALKPVSLQQGTSRQPRKLTWELSTTRLTQSANDLMLWIRHGWADQESAVLTDARAAGQQSPMIFAFLPRLQHEDLKQALATMSAAQETIEHHGPLRTPESIQAKNAIQTHLEAAKQRVTICRNQILAQAKVFLGGGSEGNGVELVDKVGDAARNALQRLFPQFSEADNANWPQVLNQARAGQVGALDAIGYQGETIRHQVCKRIYDFIGPGKKGRDVRAQFKAAPYGWPQDSIDAALVILTLGGNLRASVNGQPVAAGALNQTQISNATFGVDMPPLTVVQRLDLKALFQKIAISCQNGQESAAAAIFLIKLLELSQSAGGDAPQPAHPDVQFIRELQALSGNAQLFAIHQKKDSISAIINSWTKTKDAIVRRLPRWKRLEQLQILASGVPITVEIETSLSAIRSARSLLAEPDPVPPLVQKLLNELRRALNTIQAELLSTHKREMSRLESSPIWKKLPREKQKQLIQQIGLQTPTAIRVSNEEEIIATLQDASLENRRTLVQALSQRFISAIEQAAQLLVPKAVRVNLPSATVRNSEEFDNWLGDVRKVVSKKLKDGPVILG